MSDPYLGEIRMVGFNYAPTGWALCNGAIMAISQNNALFALLGTFYGGNGQTTFGLPDLRGRSPVGTGTGLGLSPIDIGEMAGAENTTLTINQMPNHTHTATTNGSLSVTGSVAVPACSAPATGSSVQAPGPTTVLGEASVTGHPGTLYTSTAANTTLLPFNVTSTGAAPAITVGTTGGNLPVPLRNPYLGITCIIALQGIFPSRS